MKDGEKNKWMDFNSFHLHKLFISNNAFILTAFIETIII